MGWFQLTLTVALCRGSATSFLPSPALGRLEPRAEALSGFVLARGRGVGLALGAWLEVQELPKGCVLRG